MIPAMRAAASDVPLGDGAVRDRGGRCRSHERGRGRGSHGDVPFGDVHHARVAALADVTEVRHVSSAACPVTVSRVPGWTALILTGGRSTRMGRDKAGTTVGGVTMLDQLLLTLPSTVPVVVAGPKPEHPVRPVVARQEEPPGGGPVAGVAAALAAVTTDVVGVLAVDVPGGAGLLVELVAELAAGSADALLPQGGDGTPQPLCAAYRTAALRQALRRLGDPHGRSVRDLTELLAVAVRPLDPSDTRVVDADTPEELAALRSAVPGPGILAASGREMGTPMKDWVEALRRELAVDADVDVDLVLDVAKDAAHGVQRPAAPVTTYLVGYAVARGMAPTDAAAAVHRLADEWADHA